MPAALFTRDNAREMSAKGRAAKAEKRRQRLSLEDAVNQIHAKLVATPIDIYVNDNVNIEESERPAYEVRRLKRVRRQLDLIDKRITDELAKEEPDGQRLNWLCAAQERLSEQERVLDGRPNPGSVRPTIKSMKEREQKGPVIPTAPPQQKVTSEVVKVEPPAE